MSIIHDALKKVQQSLNPKVDEIQVIPSENTQKGDTYLYSTPSPVNTEAPIQQQAARAREDNGLQNKIKSLLALIFAMAIIAGSCWYIYQQFKNNIPRVQRIAKKSFYKLLHKEEVPEFKTKAAKDLKPLGQITITPSVIALPTTAQSTTPVTLKIHGIMSNATGNLALINDQVYQEGDEIDGAKIIKINLNSITINISGTEKKIFVKN